MDGQRLVSSTRVIALLTLSSRVLGLARECAYGYFFGTAEMLSAFRIAFMLPNLARRLFGEGALSAAFIPIFTRVLHEQPRRHARRLAGAVTTLLIAILIGLTVAGELVVLAWHTLAPGITLRLAAVMLPFMAFICCAAFLGGILNALGRFAAPAASPILLNVCVLAAVLGGGALTTMTRLQLIYAACIAVLVAGVAQVGLQLAALRAVRFTPRLNRDWNRPEIKQMRRFMAPMLIGLSAVQLNTMIDMLIAKFMVPDGRGPAVLGYAHFLYQLPLGVFGIAIATAIFPIMSRSAADNDRARLSDTVVRGLRLSLCIAAPASVGLILIAYPLVAVLLQRGFFSGTDTQRVARTLILYALGLCFYSFQHILVRAFYALSRPGAPTRIAACVVLVNVALNVILVRPLAEAGVALATAVSAALQVALLLGALRQHVPALDTTSLLHSASKTVLATTGMGVIVYMIAHRLSLPATATVALAVPVGAGTYGLLARLLDHSDLLDLVRFRRSPA